MNHMTLISFSKREKGEFNRKKAGRFKRFWFRPAHPKTSRCFYRGLLYLFKTKIRTFRLTSTERHLKANSTVNLWNLLRICFTTLYFHIHTSRLVLSYCICLNQLTTSPIRGLTYVDINDKMTVVLMLSPIHANFPNDLLVMRWMVDGLSIWSEG